MKLSAYSSPAFIQDFPADSQQAMEMARRWTINVGGWIAQAMPSSSPCFFYDPCSTDIPEGTPSAFVSWSAFPGRMMQYLSDSPPNEPANPYNLNLNKIYELADTGWYDTDATFGEIPVQVCPEACWSGPRQAYGPYGPRGWQDEYCEWSTARNQEGNLVRVDFCCENPEYWNTLWQVDPERVVQIYQDVLNADVPPERRIQVTLDDLTLRDPEGRAVIDPSTGRPAYNPLNRWNSGPVSWRVGDATQFSGGVMHLTSTPNVLSTELALAGAATVQYQPKDGSGNSDPQALICCGNYGQEYRHSDPKIGQTVNVVVADQNLVCLANPVGLYIQNPVLSDPSLFAFGPHLVPGTDVPIDAKPSDIWQVIRGSDSVVDPVTQAAFPGCMILHAACQIPSSWLAMNPRLTLADMMVARQPIRWGGQIAAQLSIGLFVRPLPTPLMPAPAGCVSGMASPGQPFQCLYAAIWDAMYPQIEASPTGTAMSLASNTTLIAPQLAADGLPQQLVLIVGRTSAIPAVQFLRAEGGEPDPGIEVTVTDCAEVSYAVPGNSYPDVYTALRLTVVISDAASPGLRGVRVAVPGCDQAELPAALLIKE